MVYMFLLNMFFWCFMNLDKQKKIVKSAHKPLFEALHSIFSK
jgi:hypothetical protein